MAYRHPPGERRQPGGHRQDQVTNLMPMIEELFEMTRNNIGELREINERLMKVYDKGIADFSSLTEIEQALLGKYRGENEMKMEYPLEVINAAVIESNKCGCFAYACENACPLNKPIPQIMDAFSQVDIEYLEENYKDLFEMIDVSIKKYQEMPANEYFAHFREQHSNEIQKIFQERINLEKEQNHGESKLEVELGKIKKAVDLQYSTSPFPDFTGLACDAPCEGSRGKGCTLGSEHGPVSIKEVERQLTGWGFVLGKDVEVSKPPLVEPTGQTVVVVGAGIAGLRTAWDLKEKGHNVILMDKEERMMGVIDDGIPQNKVPSWHSHKAEWMARQKGIDVRLGTEVTKELLEQIKPDAICYATGVMDAEVEPTWVDGFKDIKKNPNYEVAYKEHLKNNTKEILEGKLIEVFDELKVAVVQGAGLTGTDCVTTLIEKAYYVIQVDRNHELGSYPGAGGYHSEVEPAWSTKQELMEASNSIVLRGANIESFKNEENNDITFRATFSKIKPSLATLSNSRLKDMRSKGNDPFEPDPEAGAIVDKDGNNIGVRMRNANHQIVEYAIDEDGVFDTKTPLNTGTIKGKFTSGEITITSNKFVAALGSKGPTENALLNEQGLVEKNDKGRKTIRIKNNRLEKAFEEKRLEYAAGDISSKPDEIYIVNAENQGTLAAAAIDSDLKALKQAQEKNGDFNYKERLSKIPVVARSPLAAANQRIANDTYRDM